MKNSVKEIGIILITILLLSFITIPTLVKGDSVSSSTSSGNSAELKQVLDNKYIGLLGLTNNITSIKSSITLESNAKEGFSYVGNFSTSKASYLIRASQFQETIGNQVLSTATQNITGATNSSASDVQNVTTTSNLIIKHIVSYLQESNSSGNYYLSISLNDTANTLSPNKLSGNVSVSENYFGPIGIYTAILSPQINSNGTNAIITSPAGERMTAGYGPVQTSATSSESSSKVTNPSPDYAQGPPPPMGWGQIDISPFIEGSYSMSGLFVYWSPGWGIVFGIIAGIVGAIIGSVDPMVWVLMTYGGLVLALSSAFPCTMWFDNVLATYNVMYILVKYYDLVVMFNSPWVRIPCYAELGYYSNDIICPTINNGQQTHWPLGSDGNTYTYFDAANSEVWWIAFIETIIWGGHTDPWDTDPPVNYLLTLAAYDESSSSYVEGIPIAIDATDSNWLPTSNSAFSFPAGDHCFQAANDGSAFDYFDVGGTPVYSNPTTTTISQDTTIVAVYHYTPCAWLTVDFVDTSNNDLGSSSSYVPFGFYTVGGGGSPIWDDYLGYYVVPEGQAYTIAMVSDTYITILCGLA